MKVSALRYAAIGLATASLAGFAAASTVSLGTTGPDSNNQVKINNTNKETTKNINKVGVANLSFQLASTGDATAHHNTTADGDLSSGAADNFNSTDTSVAVSNAPAGGGGALAAFNMGNDDVSIDTTGPDSNNQVWINNKNEIKTTNYNNVEVLNLNLQAAASGDVKAHHNTTVGGLSSGDATNTNTTTTTVEISNE